MTDQLKDLSTFIDHTLLKPEATPDMVGEMCEQAREHAFCSVCIAPVFVRQAAAQLKGSGVSICTVVGFPSGVVETEVKAFETRRAIADGADEIDMVMNVGALKAGNRDQVQSDIAAVVGSADGRIVKVILETCLLEDEEKREACRLAVAAGARFVKTSTGFSHGGATLADVRLMRETVGSDIGVKASGGIRDRETALHMLEAGANRLGTSSGLQIIGAAKS